jgi:CDP-glycerol glycerophosphotransferase
MRLPLYALGRLATLVIPRSRDEWVFGCATGIGDGALALWDVVAAEGHPAVWLVANPREERDAAAHGIHHVRKNSISGLWRTARARVVVVTHGFGDANRYAQGGAFVVQLWHGIPLKRIGLDSPETTRSPIRIGGGVVSRLLAVLYRGAARRIRVIPAASHLVRGRLESAFGLPDDRVPVTGEPRADVLSAGTPDARRTNARAAIGQATGTFPPETRLVLCAPTWRDGDPDPATPTGGEWEAIVDVLARHDAILLVRSHHLGAGDYTPPFATERVRPLGSDVVSDVTPLLSGLDALVTDYSSLIFDSSLVPLPVVYLAPDVDAYAARRGFYGTFADVAGDDIATTWTDAAAHLDAVLGDEAEREHRLARARAIDAAVHDFRDGANTRRVYRAIRARIGDDAEGRR